MRKQGAIYLPSFSFYPIPRTRLTALALTALLSVEKYLLLYFNYSIIWSQPLRGRCACLITLIREKRKRKGDGFTEGGWGALLWSFFVAYSVVSSFFVWLRNEIFLLEVRGEMRSAGKVFQVLDFYCLLLESNFFLWSVWRSAAHICKSVILDDNITTFQVYSNDTLIR